jgi:hypothetical protein
MSGNLDAVQTFTDPAARIKRISRPVATPAKCAICGKADHPEGFAATDNFDFEFFGTVYFCADCVGDYARVFGFMSRKEIEDLLVRLDAQEKEIKTLRSAVVNLESIVDAYSHLRNVKPDALDRSGNGSDASESADERDSEQLARVISIAPDVIDAGVSGEREISERGDEPGRDDVQPTESDDSFLTDLGIT